jgi:hypothetical protein
MENQSSAATASSSRSVPLSRSPSLKSALPRFICVVAHWSGTRARVLLQRCATGGDGLPQPRRPALSRAKRPERGAEVVLRSRPVERHPRPRPLLKRRARPLLKRRAIGGDRLLQPLRPARLLAYIGILAQVTRAREYRDMGHVQASDT